VVLLDHDVPVVVGIAGLQHAEQAHGAVLGVREGREGAELRRVPEELHEALAALDGIEPADLPALVGNTADHDGLEAQHDEGDVRVLAIGAVDAVELELLLGPERPEQAERVGIGFELPAVIAVVEQELSALTVAVEA
jgi:hypothetical protein